MSKLSHINEEGKANMVDVAAKKQQVRTARATGFISLGSETLALLKENQLKKGDVLTVAEIAGIQAAKRTSELIPLCHPLLTTKAQVETQVEENGIRVNSLVKCIGQTGVEMEALTAVNIALLTIYDMCKAVDKTMKMSDIYLLEKIKEDLDANH